MKDFQIRLVWFSQKDVSLSMGSITVFPSLSSDNAFSFVIFPAPISKYLPIAHIAERIAYTV